MKSETARNKKVDDIMRVFDQSVELRKKKDLVKKFIEENLPKIDKLGNVEKAFGEFWSSERSAVLKKIAKDENIPVEKFEAVIGEYLYSQKLPRGQDIADMLPEKPRILERQGIIDRIRSAIQNIVDVFEW